MHIPHSTNILIYIESIFNSLTKSEKKIASLTLKNPERIIYSSITDVANEVGVADATVLRFCRKLGFQSYQTFKLQLGQSIQTLHNDKVSVLDIDLSEEDSVNKLMEKTFNINLRALQETLSLISPIQLEDAANTMIHARKIYLCGIGMSAITAQDIVAKLLRIGLNATFVHDLHFQMMQASMLSDQDVAFAISASGSTQETCQVLELCRKSGAKTICLTHHAHSPITKIADTVLLHSSKEKLIQGGALSTKISQLLVLDMLYNLIATKLGDSALSNKQTTLNAIIDKLL